MNPRSRASVLTGLSFPFGSVLGLFIGRSTVPASTGGGFGDIVYILLWFVIAAPLLALTVYVWSTRAIEWDRQSRSRAFVHVLLGVALATLCQMLLLVVLGRGGNGLLVFAALPITALIVTLFAKKALKA